MHHPSIKKSVSELTQIAASLARISCCFCCRNCRSSSAIFSLWVSLSLFKLDSWVSLSFDKKSCSLWFWSASKASLLAFNVSFRSLLGSKSTSCFINLVSCLRLSRNVFNSFSCSARIFFDVTWKDKISVLFFYQYLCNLKVKISIHLHNTFRSDIPLDSVDLR